MKIGIIGAGELGIAIKTILLAGKQERVFVWDIDESKLQEKVTLEEVVQDANLLFLCIPSWVVRTVLQKIKPMLLPQTIVIVCAKGIEESKKTMDKVLEEEIPKQSFALLSGPMLAEELMKKKCGYALVATQNAQVYAKIAQAFEKSSLITLYSSDLSGVAICGILKNVYAIGMGIVEGLKLGANTMGAIVNQVGKEMLEIIPLFDGDPETVFSFAGTADLIATGFSHFSQNRKVGQEIAKTKTCCLESEGSKSIDSLVLLLEDISDYPVLSAIYASVKHPEQVKEYFHVLITQKLAQ